MALCVLSAVVAAFALVMWNFSNLRWYLVSIWEVLVIGQYYFLHAVVSAIQRLVWACNGVQDQLLMAEYGGAYDSSVQVLRIIHRGRFSTMNHPRPWDFIGLHENFTHPQVLLSPYVTLYCMNETHAYFIQSPEDIDVHYSRTSPFMYMAQFGHATKLFCIPLVHFHKLASEVGDPVVPVIWFSNTGRCGSTLLIQMLENLPGTRCMSEPDAFTNISLMARANQMSKEQIRECLQSTVRMLCKPAPGIHRYVIKLRFNCVIELGHILDLYPDHKQVFLYRNLGNVMRSYYKFLHRDVAMIFLAWLVNNELVKRLIPYVRNYLVHFISENGPRDKVKRLLPEVNFMGYVTAIVCSGIIEFKQILETTRRDIPTLHYDELMRCPVEVTSRLFEELQLPSHYVHMALTAMQHDTQKGTILSNISNNRCNIRKMTGKDVKDMNKIITALGLPDMNSEFYLPNAIEA